MLVFLALTFQLVAELNVFLLTPSMRAMVRVDLDKIKSDINHYIELVEQGETLVVVRSDREIAEIKPITNDVSAFRPQGLCAGEFTVPDGFDDFLIATCLARAIDERGDARPGEIVDGESDCLALRQGEGPP